MSARTNSAVSTRSRSKRKTATQSSPSLRQDGAGRGDGKRARRSDDRARSSSATSGPSARSEGLRSEVSASSPHLELNNWCKLKHVQLQRVCKKFNIAHGGTKKELAGRLIQNKVAIPSADELTALFLGEVAPLSAEELAERAEQIKRLNALLDPPQFSAPPSQPPQPTHPQQQVPVVIIDESEKEHIEQPRSSDAAALETASDTIARCLRERAIPAHLPLRTRELLVTLLSASSATPVAPTAGSGSASSSAADAASAATAPPVVAYTPVVTSPSDPSSLLSLSKSLADKVKSGAYVDLSLFLHDTLAAPEETYDLAALTPSGSDSEFVLQCKRASTQRTRHVEDVDSWNEAFGYYAECVCQHRASLRPDFMHYGRVINQAFRKFGFRAVYDYDVQLRRRRAGFVAPWAPLDNDLFVMSVTPAYRQAARRNDVATTAAATTSRSRQTCFNWNKGIGCRYSPCKFAHVCQKCNGSHKVSECKKGQMKVEVSNGPNGRSKKTATTSA